MRRFVSLDIETTGLDPLKHEMIEVGLVIERSRTVDHISFDEVAFSLPFDLERADEKALEINGWGKREFAPLWDPYYAAGFLQEVLSDAHIIGKNPMFDTAFMEAFLNTHGMKRTWHHRLVDIGSMAWGYYNGEHDGHLIQPPDSSQVGFIMGIPNNQIHTALGDARWNYKVFTRMTT